MASLYPIADPLPKAQKRQDRQNNNHESNKINNAVHIVYLFFVRPIRSDRSFANSLAEIRYSSTSIVRTKQLSQNIVPALIGLTE